MLSTTESILTLRDCAALLRRSTYAVARLVRDGKFPAPLPMGPGCRRWLRADIEKWLAQHSAANAAPRDPLTSILERAVAMAGEGPVKQALQRLLAGDPPL